MKAFAQALVTVLEARQAAAPSNDLVTSINNAKNNARALDALFASKAFAPVAKNLLTNLAIESSAQNREDFIAVKVVVKLVRAANALAKNQLSGIDNYSVCIIKNLVKLQSVSNKDALVAVSSSIHYTEEDQKKALIARIGSSAGTATTQASSTRMMLKNLDICEVLKSKRGDTLTFKDNERAKMLVALFNGKGEAMVTAASAAPVAEEKPAAAPVKATAKKTATAKPAAPKETAKPATAKKPAAAKPEVAKAATTKPATAKKTAGKKAA